MYSAADLNTVVLYRLDEIAERLCYPDRLITITQYVTDLCLNEIERRGELTVLDGVPVVPYQCEYMVETVLTRSRI